VENEEVESLKRRELIIGNSR